MPRTSFFSALLLGATTGLLTSCEKPQIRVYTAPKDPPPRAEHQHAADEAPPSRAALPKPKVSYQLPAGWKETTPGEVSVAAFTITGEGGEAVVNVTPLPNLEGQEAMVVNMYRQQAGLPPIEQSELASVLKPAEVAGGTGQLIELAGRNGEKNVRILTAIAHQDGRSWFYRMTGEDAFVAAQKPAFLEFLKSVRITDERLDPAEPKSASTAAAPQKFNWPVPEGWTSVAPGQMQVAKFSVPERDGAKADMSVSIFPSDTGGTLANVNRWRKQLGLPEVDQAGLAPLLSPLDAATPDALLVTLNNQQRALLGAIVPRDGQWWFYKLMGDAPAVTAQREAFAAFAKAQP